MDTPIDVVKFKELLVNSTGYVGEARGGEQIISLCPWCETEKFGKHVDHGHLHINIFSLQTN